MKWNENQRHIMMLCMYSILHKTIIIIFNETNVFRELTLTVYIHSFKGKLWYVSASLMFIIVFICNCL
jgi:hypothetical protein